MTISRHSGLRAGNYNKRSIISMISVKSSAYIDRHRSRIRSGMTIICFALLIINIAYAVVGVWRYGSQHIDAYGIWMLKAKAIQLEGGIPLKLLRDPAYSYSHQTYPLLVPFMLSLGEWTLWLYPVAYVAILLLLYRILRNESHSHMSALGWTTAVSFMGPLIAQGGRMHAGLADIWITLCVALCVVFVQRKQWWAVVGVVMIASMIKTEGIFLLAFLLVQDRTSSWLLRYIVAIVPFMIWQVAVRMWALPSDVMFGLPGFAELFHRLVIVVVGVGKEMVNWRNWYVMWGIFWLNLICRGRSCASPRQPQGIAPTDDNWGRILGIIVMGYGAVYLFADMDTAGYVASSVDRIMLQLLPLWWMVGFGHLQARLEQKWSREKIL